MFYPFVHEKSLFLDILESSPFYIIVVDLEGKVRFINPKVEKYARVSKAKAIGMPIHSIFPNFNLIETLSTKQAMQRIEINQQIFILNHSPFCINGKCLGTQVFFIEPELFEDVIDELLPSNKISNQMNALFENSQDGLFLTNGKGYIVRINKAYEEMTGFKRDFLVGMHMSSLENKKMISKSVTLKVLEEKKTITQLQTLENKKQILVTSSPVFDKNGQIEFVVSNARDITYLKLIEKDLEKSKFLTENFSAEIANAIPVEADSILLESPKMKQVIEHIHQIAKYPTTIFLRGETGVGKEVIASLIHQYSPRANNPFIKINCSAIPESLIESELFGYEKGAFSGANKQGKPGMLELANGGTVLLDEIGDLPLNIQVKLLRILQERELIRVGGTKIIPLDIRVISATNKDLIDLIRKKQFREDLYYRLNVVDIYIPPLRERKENIRSLIFYYLKRFTSDYRIDKHISDDALTYLELYSWPGNIRELKNLIENLIVSTASSIILSEHLPSYMKKPNVDSYPCNQEDISEDTQHLGLRERIAMTEKAIILESLRKHKSIRKTASFLKIDHSTLSRKMDKLGINYKFTW